MSQNKTKILIVDDVAANLLALEQLIEAPDRVLVRANSGEEALEALLGDQNFAVILMDVQMPGLDGVETVQLLKAKESCQDIPIIFLTAFDKEGRMELDAYSSGAVDYVMKPIQAQVLTSKVDVFVELYRIRQKLITNNKHLEAANLKLTREISRRERAEAQLRLADQAIHDSHESILITDDQGLIQRVNPAYCQRSGFTSDELINTNITSLSHQDAQVDHTLMLAALHDKGEWSGELHCQKKNGKHFSTWAHISGIYNVNKILTHYCGILSEVNDPQKTELVLRKVKMRLEQAQEISHLGAWEWNNSERDIYCSNELFHILGSSAEQLSPSIAMCEKFIHPDDQYKFEAIIQSLKSGQSSDSRLRLLLPSGVERMIHQQTEVSCNAQGKPVQLIGTVHDITEHAKLEESFLQAQKMEAVGTMVGGIAHEFNNILAGMSGHIYLAKCNAEHSTKVAEHLTKLELLGSRAAETIQQMLTFSRKGSVNMAEVDLNALVLETLKLHKSSVPEYISLDHALCDDILIINADKVMIQQLMLNLIINARDALSESSAPAIKLTLQRIEADASFLSKHPDAHHGAYAQLSIRDNGCGIEPDKADIIFEPFFTTKGDHGTGLGLSMVYGAVQSHQGIIQLESQPEQGSAFHIYFPLLNEHNINKHNNQPKVIQKKQLVQGHAETILIADDEKIVRDTVRDTLQILGYTVITAHDGQQALDIFSEYQDDIKLIILDIIMPKLNGIDAASAIRDIQADAPIVFMTGYNEEYTSGHWVESQETVIMKPFSIQTFSQVISDAL